jgi:hypothetical protein
MTGVERRKYIRHPFSYPLTVTSVHLQEGGNYESKNVGGGGLQFHSDRCFSQGHGVEIDLWVDARKFELTGSVVRCDELEDGSFMVAVVFRSASEALKARLAEQAVRIELFKERLERRHRVKLDLGCVANEWIKRYAGAYARDHDF